MCNLFMSSVDCLDYNYVISGLPSDSEINWGSPAPRRVFVISTMLSFSNISAEI